MKLEKIGSAVLRHHPREIRTLDICGEIRRAKGVQELRRVVRIVNEWIRARVPADYDQIAIELDRKAHQFGYKLIEFVTTARRGGAVRCFKLVKAKKRDKFRWWLEER